MAIYTLELRKLLRDSNFKLFDFDYDFYSDDEEIKINFESKFTDTYFFYELGFETVARFKHELKSLLNRKMPYYRELYKTELASKDMNFLLNKDLKEIMQRDSDDITLYKSNSSANNTSNSNNRQTSKESNIGNGLSSVDLNSSLTSESEDISNNNDVLKSNSNTTNENKGNTKEKSILISQGNIGTTSTGKLLEDWRNVLQNLDELIIEDCRELFMLIY